MFLIAILTAGLALVGQVWHTALVREKEKELLFVGNQFRRAIEHYYAANTGRNERLPKSLENLLLDENQPGVKRYLRQIYVDPLTGKTEWGLMLGPQGGIMGVYSLARGTPLKQTHFSRGQESFDNAKTYKDWAFVFSESEANHIALNARAAPGTPANPAAAPPQAVAPPAPPPEPPKPQQTKRYCEKIMAFDAEVCAQQLEQWGEARECEQTSVLRRAACAAGEQLPPLYIRYL